MPLPVPAGPNSGSEPLTPGRDSGLEPPRGQEQHQERGAARRSRLNPTVGTGRRLLRECLEAYFADHGSGTPAESPAHPAATVPLLLVACSGGPDSLALAAVTAFFARRGDYRAGAVIVDHGLQPDSAAVAEQARRTAVGLGLHPVEVRTVTVDARGLGPEAAARTARHGALAAAAAAHGASAVLLGHTLDDQAEQVLLGLARGSGTRSLAGMPVRRGLLLRPFLQLRRADTLAICAAEGLTPWHDPSNADPSFVRSRVRTEVLPFLEDRLGPGVAPALARSARILGEDADFLDTAAAEQFARLRERRPDGLHLGLDALAGLPAALRHRVMALAAVELGAERPSFERVLAAETLLQRRGSAGPVQLAGRVSVFRQGRARPLRPEGSAPPEGPVPQEKPGYGTLVFRQSTTPQANGGQLGHN